MAIRELKYYPDELLHKNSEIVTEFNEELKNTISDMFETMYAEEGIGLAAPQIGLLKQIVVINVEGIDNKEAELVLINPEIINKEGETGINEGCLSVPELRAFVKRAEKITVKAQNIDGETFTKEADGLLAICMQHEIDHLHGTLFIDYLSTMKQNLYRAKVAKILKRKKQEKENN